MKLKVALALAFFINLANAQENYLFKIVENDKVGYINSKGKVIIEPKYHSGYDFSDGVAAVRENGLYGFIDTSGNYILEPKYDGATHFHNGYSYVFVNGEPQIINKKGESDINPVFSGLTFISRLKAIVITKSKKQGVIDLESHKLIADTIYSDINNFNNGVAVCRTLENTYTVIDTLGKVIVKAGKYKTIHKFSDGIAVVDDNRGSVGAINTIGELLFLKNIAPAYIDDDSSFYYDQSGFNNGYASVTIPEEDHHYRHCYIDSKGNLHLKDSLLRGVSRFSNNRAFIEKDNQHILIDNNFKTIDTLKYDFIINDSFHNGYAVVGIFDNYGLANYGVIDTTGRFVVKPEYEDVDKTGIIGNYIFPYEDNDYDDYWSDRYGIVNLQGKMILQPVMQWFDRNGFNNGLLRALINDRLTYIDEEGNIVWQEKKYVSKELLPYNIDYMNRGYFRAYSKNIKSNGWAESDNLPQKIESQNFKKNTIQIVINTSETTPYQEKYKGYTVYLANTTRKEIEFSAQDSRLYITIQAIDNKGVWKDIEYTPSSWCGNSYHKVTLGSNEYWQFVMPKYEGGTTTKLRAKLYVNKGKNEKIVYSNEIEGSINPGQFFNKLQYVPSNMMTPYND